MIRVEVQYTTEAAELKAWAAEAPPGKLILESHADLRFTDRLAGAELNIEDSILGCLFGGGQEIRWIQDANSLYAWRIREGSGDTVYQPVTRRYYGWGELVGAEFGGGRMSKTISYRVDTAGHPAGARPYFEVREYWRVEPAWPDDVATVEALLDHPGLFAYRVAGVHIADGPEDPA